MLHNNEFMQCSICLDVITDQSCTTECGHFFHSKCVFKWIVLNNKCPVCRKTLCPKVDRPASTSSERVVHERPPIEIPVTSRWDISSLSDQDLVRLNNMRLRNLREFADNEDDIFTIRQRVRQRQHVLAAQHASTHVHARNSRTGRRTRHAFVRNNRFHRSNESHPHNITNSTNDRVRPERLRNTQNVANYRSPSVEFGHFLRWIKSIAVIFTNPNRNHGSF